MIILIGTVGGLHLQIYIQKRREKTKNKAFYLFFTSSVLHTTWNLHLRTLERSGICNCSLYYVLHYSKSIRVSVIKNEELRMLLVAFQLLIFFFFFKFSKNTTTEEFFLKTKRFTYVFNMYLKRFIQMSIFLLLLLPFFFLNIQIN